MHSIQVYRNPRDPNLILANWLHGASEHGMASVGTSLMGLSVDIKFQLAFNEAALHGVPFLWVDDPEGLFARAERPQIAG